jgi:hypothetical protein
MKSALRLLTDLLLAPPITHSAVEGAVPFTNRQSNA